MFCVAFAIWTLYISRWIDISQARRGECVHMILIIYTDCTIGWPLSAPVKWTNSIYFWCSHWITHSSTIIRGTTIDRICQDYFLLLPQQLEYEGSVLVAGSLDGLIQLLIPIGEYYPDVWFLFSQYLYVMILLSFHRQHLSLPSFYAHVCSCPLTPC